MDQRRWMTPPEIAKLLGIDVHKVASWIRSGELIACNLGDGGRPRWKVSHESLERFLDVRQSRPPAPPPIRRKRLPEVKNYF